MNKIRNIWWKDTWLNTCSKQWSLAWGNCSVKRGSLHTASLSHSTDAAKLLCNVHGNILLAGLCWIKINLVWWALKQLNSADIMLLGKIPTFLLLSFTPWIHGMPVIKEAMFYSIQFKRGGENLVSPPISSWHVSHFFFFPLDFFLCYPFPH